MSSSFDPANGSRPSTPRPERGIPARAAAYAHCAPRYVPVRFDEGWVVWDRQHGRVADGIYSDFHADFMMPLCNHFNEHPDAGDRDWLAGSWWSGQPGGGW